MQKKDITTRPGVPTPRGVTTGVPGKPAGKLPPGTVPKTWWERYGRLVIIGSVAFIVLLGVTTYAMMSDTRPSRFGEMAPDLLRGEDVATELNLSDEQKEKVREIRDLMNYDVSRNPETLILPPPQKEKKRNYYHRVALKAITSALSPEQMLRLRQIYYQSRRREASLGR